MPASTKKDATEGDAAIARSLLYFNNSTRNLRSWLPSNIKAGSISAENEQLESDIEGDDEEGGLKYSAPVYSSVNDRQSLSTNEKLREQLLGNRSKLSYAQGGPKNRSSNGVSASKPRPQTVKQSRKDSDDESEGRTFTTEKRSLNKLTDRPSQPKGLSKNGQATHPTRVKKRSMNYLDEVLAQRISKKNKCKNQND